MNKSAISLMAAIAFCIGGTSLSRAEAPDVSCGDYAWPYYPQECLVKTKVQEEAGATVRVVRYSPSEDTAKPVALTDSRFDDRNYFDPLPAYLEQFGLEALATFSKG